MKVRTLAITTLIAFCAAYFVCWLGWFTYRPGFPWFHIDNKRQFAALVVLSLPWVMPGVVWILQRRFGGKRTAAMLVPAGALLAISYLAGAAWYYNTTVRPFDPFVQTPALRPRVPVEKKAGTFRILALGGSTTYLEYKPLEFNYPWKLEQHLNMGDGRVLEVINGGKSFYTTRHSLINYTTYYRQWKPDLVIVMEAINDVYRSFSPSKYAVGEYNDLYSHFYGPSANGAHPPGFDEFLLRKLWSGAKWYAELRTHEVEMPIEEFRSLDAFQRNLASLIHYGHADGAQVVVMTQPSLYREGLTAQETSRLWLRKQYCVVERSAFETDIPTTKSMALVMKAFNDAALRVADQNGALTFDADAVLPKSLAMFVDDVHYTDEGSTRLATALGERLTRLGVLGSRSPVADKHAP